MFLGEILKLLRISNHMNLKDASSNMGISLADLSYIEVSKINPNIKNLYKISETYNMPISQIFYFVELRQSGMSKNDVWKRICMYYINMDYEEQINNKKMI